MDGPWNGRTQEAPAKYRPELEMQINPSSEVATLNAGTRLRETKKCSGQGLPRTAVGALRAIQTISQTPSR